MSTYGITVTILATKLAEAVLADEAPEEGGFDLSAGMFGVNVSKWLRETACEFDASKNRLHEISEHCASVEFERDRLRAVLKHIASEINSVVDLDSGTLKA